MIIIETHAVGPFFKNGFVVSCARTRQGVLIDPGDEVDRLLGYVDAHSIAISHILLTHAHIDHVTGVDAAKRALGVPVMLHRNDLFLYEAVLEQARMFDLRMNALPPPIDRFYAPGEIIPVGDIAVRPLHTPGHCPGGVCLEVTPAAPDRPVSPADRDLFVGDTLFAGSIGRTDLPGGDYTTLLASIRDVLFPLGDEARVHPGHGPSTTIGQERRTNPFVAEKA